MSRPYPLNQKLPTHVFPHSWWNYNTFSFPIYSWPWFWRYAAVFIPVGIFFGLMSVSRIAQVTNDNSLALQAALRSCAVWIVVALLGPLLGALVRNGRFDSKRESQFLIVMVALAMGLAWLGRVWYQDFLLHAVHPILVANGKPDAIVSISSQRSVRLLSLGAFWFTLLWCSIEPLHAYYSELRRWKRFEAARAIERARQERDTADLRLAVLQAQVEPHFLYNTMASVRSLVRSDPGRAEATIDALVDHLRATLPKIRDNQTLQATLGNQVDICRSYLEVMRVRMGDRFSYRIDVPARLLDNVFPPMMLISLVENAIKHGVEPKPGPCTVTIAARTEAGANRAIEVSIADDGAGLREGPSEGVGLANIRAQLSTRFGDRASLRLESGAGGGTIATIKVPTENALA